MNTLTRTAIIALAGLTLSLAGCAQPQRIADMSPAEYRQAVRLQHIKGPQADTVAQPQAEHAAEAREALEARPPPVEVVLVAPPPSTASIVAAGVLTGLAVWANTRPYRYRTSCTTRSYGYKRNYRTTTSCY